MKPKNIPIAVPHLEEEEWLALREPLETGWLTQGPKVAAFEKAFAARHSAKHAVATTSCTTALHLILAALEIGPGDEVIVPAFTWVATANVVLYCGAVPVFADVDRATYNLDPAEIPGKITPRTRAVIVVHLFGLCADVDAVAKAAPGIPILEDAACAAGSTYRGRSAGCLGSAGAFSFHPRKVITTGEGGMITTNSEELAQKLTVLRNHGAGISEEERHRGPRPYLLPEFSHLGFNYRMTDLQGALGLVQLGRLDGLIAQRRQWAEYYNRALGGIPWLHLPVPPPGYGTNWQSYVCRIDAGAPCSRNEIMEKLQSRGISTRPGTHCVPTLDYYRRRFDLRPEDVPVAWDSEHQTIALPIHSRMSPQDYDRVVEALRELG
ncbi:MAG TPA: DegT/DnrJ/EryC1/StrS family aminotransferase [Syntrophobacteraceae bacterium]|nr:DegT/DnrJ/EryC1/StrS family aminotransferase [Syntrophobacteraceae bacterium]